MTQAYSAAPAPARDSLFVAAMPWLFVLIWSTGFIVAKYGMPYAEPITFLFLRFVGVLVCLLPLVWLARVPLPRRAGTHDVDWTMIGHLAVAGVLMQWGYLAGVWAAVKLGMPAGMTALIVGMQPILTALYVSMRGERVTGRQWLGLLCGIAGVGLVVANKLHLAGVGVTTLALCVGALLSITIGTLYQKRHCPVFDLRMGGMHSVRRVGAAVPAVHVPVRDARGALDCADDWLAGVVGAGAVHRCNLAAVRADSQGRGDQGDVSPLSDAANDCGDGLGAVWRALSAAGRTRHGDRCVRCGAGDPQVSAADLKLAGVSS